jgi:transposase
VTLDQAGRWHVAFAAVPRAIPTPGNGQVVGVDRGVAVSAALSTGDLLRIPGLRLGERRRLRLLMTRSAKGTRQRPGRGVRHKAGLSRGILAAGWGRLVDRPEQQAPGRVLKVAAAYTSQACNACGHIARESRESQPSFRCVACGHEAHADVNAAQNIAAAGQVVAAGGGQGLPRPVNRVPPTLGAVA